MFENTDIKLLTTETRRNYSASEPNYHTTNFLSENLLAMEMRKTQIIMNKPVYLGPTMLQLSEIVMIKSWYDCAKPK